MATTQDIKDQRDAQLALEIDFQKMLNSQKLHEIFSNVILGWGLQNGCTTYEDFINYTGILNLSKRKLVTLKGIDHLTSFSKLYFYSNNLSDIGDLSGMVELTYLRLYDNNLSDVGSLSGLTKLTYLQVQNNNLSDVGDLSALTDLMYLTLHNNNLSDIGSLSGLTYLIELNLENNNFSTDKIDGFLSNMRSAYDTTGVISVIKLSGNSVPTGGASNADYLYLVGQGVSVTIDTV